MLSLNVRAVQPLVLLTVGLIAFSDDIVCAEVVRQLQRRNLTCHAYAKAAGVDKAAFQTRQ